MKHIPPRWITFLCVILSIVALLARLDGRRAMETYASGAAQTDGQKRVDYLLERLESGSDYKVRIAAANGLGKIADGTVADWMLRAFRKENEKAVRLAIIYAIAQIPDHRVIPPLLELAHEEFLSEQEIIAVERVIWNLRKAVALVEWARTLIDSKEKSERALSAYVLGLTADATAAEVLIPALSDANPFVRMRAAQALGHIASRKGVAPCKSAKSDSDAGVRRAAHLCEKEIDLQLKGRVPKENQRRVDLRNDLYGLEENVVTIDDVRRYLQRNVNPRALDRALLSLTSKDSPEDRYDKTSKLVGDDFRQSTFHIEARFLTVHRFGASEIGEIRNLVRKQSAKVNQCYLSALKKDRKLAGSVAVRFLVHSNGAASTVSIIGGTLQSTSVHRCIAQEIGSIRFPTHPLKYVVMNYKYSFEPPKDQRFVFPVKD